MKIVIPEGIFCSSVNHDDCVYLHIDRCKAFKKSLLDVYPFADSLHTVSKKCQQCLSKESITIHYAGSDDDTNK